jgi:hypothetical protein
VYDVFNSLRVRGQKKARILLRCMPRDVLGCCALIKNQIFKFRETARQNPNPIRVRGAKKARFLLRVRLITSSNLTGALYGKLARLGALEDTIRIRRRAPKIIDHVISVGEQAAEFSEEAVRIEGQGDHSEPPTGQTLYVNGARPMTPPSLAM